MEVKMFGDGRLRVPSTSSLAGADTPTQKGPIEHSSRFLEKFRRASAAGATEVASNRATGAGAVSPGNKLLNRAVPSQCNARYANGRTVVNERHGFMFSNHHHQENTTIERDDEAFTVRQPYLSALTDVLR